MMHDEEAAGTRCPAMEIEPEKPSTLAPPLQCSVAWSVFRLSSVCHIYAPCLNRSTDLDASWQVYLWGPKTHCVTRRSMVPKGTGDYGIKPTIHNIQLQIAARPSVL